MLTQPKQHVDKVICYVTHRNRLLVFSHTDYSHEEVGIQVPAGTICSGETPEAAALREVEEETTLHGFEDIMFLGTTTFDITPVRHEIQHRHFFWLPYTGEPTERWHTQELHDGKSPPTNFTCFWIPIAHGHILQSGQSEFLSTLWEHMETASAHNS